MMVVILVGLVILTAVAIGLPSIWLIQDQLSQQAWSLARQGGRTTGTLLNAYQSDLADLALLTAQRPTLQRLIQAGSAAELAAYLETLRAGADLDLVLICNPDQQPLAQAGLPAPPEACGALEDRHVFWTAGPQAGGWFLSAQPVADTLGGYSVVAGQALDRSLAERLRDQTGMEQVFLMQGAVIAGSFPDPRTAWTAISARMNPAQESAAFQLGDTPYYAIRARYGSSDLETVASLSVENIVAAQRQLTTQLAAGMLAVVLVSTGAGIFLSRRLTWPLEHLRDSANTLRRGDLLTPVTARTRLPEIAQVAYALEDARITLQHSLQELRREKEWTDHLLESVVEGIVTLDRQRRITYFSRGAERISGWEQSQVIGRQVDEIFRLPEERGRFSDNIPAPGGKQTILVVSGNERQATLAITGALLAPPFAGRSGTALVLRDVSDEEAIRRLLGDFLANITHEFRTPLAALAASIELLLDQLPSLSQAELKELLDSLRLGVLGLQTLIDNLLEGASIEAGRFRVNPHPADLGGIALEVVATLQPLLEKYNQRLQVEIPEGLPQVQADPRRTAQVLVNLISNAIKWGPPGSEISLSLSLEGKAVRVGVGDRGPGVPPGQHQNLFSRFAHLDLGNHRAESGAGLGLSVVKAIVEAQGGQVGVDDRPGGGAVFWFTVPLSGVDAV